MRVFGASLGHDTNFALIEDGKVVQVVEAERYYRQKRYKLSADNLSVQKQVSGYQYVFIDELEETLERLLSLWGKEFDAIAVQNQGRQKEYENFKRVLQEKGVSYKDAYHVDHHLSHAALAFYTSPFSDALVLSYDGTGNDGYTVCFKADQKEGVVYVERNETRFGQSYNNLGYVIGVSPDISGTSAGKTMGLTSYGCVRDEWFPDAQKYVKEYRKIRHKSKGLNAYGREHCINDVGLRDIVELKGYSRFPENSSLLERVFSRGKKRLRLNGVDDKDSQDLAKTVQAAWTEEVLSMLEKYKDVSRNVCVVGGCALNGITNYAIQKSEWFDEVHFVPNASDCGLAAGAALRAYYIGTESKTFNGYGAYYSPYLGEEAYDKCELPEYQKQYPNVVVSDESVARVLASLLLEDVIIGVVKGRYEIGPRALGNRSILCNPLNRNMRDILNEKVKHREWYRPFAPVSTAEDSQKFFTNCGDIPYMSVICHTREGYREALPSITHVDGSARLQTVRQEQNGFLYKTLKEFEKLSGYPILLNTSFNPGGEPILNYYKVALEMLDNTDLDMVLVENVFFTSKENRAFLEKVVAIVNTADGSAV